MKKRTAVSALLAAVSLAWALTAQAEPGVSDGTILIGQSAPLSGPAEELGKEMKAGAQLYFDHINRQGGINGRKIELRSLDDGYEPERTTSNTKQLIEKDGVFSLFGFVGTPTSQAALQVSNPAKVPFVGAFTGSDALRTPFNRLVFNIRAGYGDESEKIVDQVTSLNVRNIAVFYQNDSFGKTALASIEKALAKRGLKPVATGTVERNSQDVAAAVKSIGAAKPDMVILVSTYKSCAAFIKSLRAAGAAPQFFTMSFVGSHALARELGSSGAGIGISQVAPYPWTATTPVVREYQKLLKQAGGNQELSYVSLEGFIAAKVFAEGIKRAGKDLSRDKFITAMEGLRNFDVGGFTVNFGPANHNGSSYVELTVIRQDGTIKN